MMNSIETPYFSKGLKYLTPVFFLAGICLMIRDNLFFGVTLAIVGAVILTTKYVTTIDLHQKLYKDYLSLLGIPLNVESGKFNAIEKIIITKDNHAYSANTRSRARQVNFSDYTATLIFDRDQALDLLTKNNKHELLSRLKTLAEFLRIGIEDHTTNEAYEIDLSKIG